MSSLSLSPPHFGSPVQAPPGTPFPQGLDPAGGKIPQGRHIDPLRHPPACFLRPSRPHTTCSPGCRVALAEITAPDLAWRGRKGEGLSP